MPFFEGLVDHDVTHELRQPCSKRMLQNKLRYDCSLRIDMSVLALLMGVHSSLPFDTAVRVIRDSDGYLPTLINLSPSASWTW